LEVIRALQLSFTSGIGNITIKKLIEKYKRFENIFELSHIQLSKDIGDKLASLILKDKEAYKKAVKEYEKAQRLNITLVPLSDDNYPINLKNIPDPPPVLYIKGIFPFSDMSVSIVGTRNVSSYGRFITQKFSKELSENSISIVSGLALGVDTIAHKTTLENSGFTVAVLGCGVDIIFPKENLSLYRDILKNGCIVSELPIGTRPTKYTFPKRNRIIAGLSLATIVSQAPMKSGALITAKYANEYGRLVFSVPANINDKSSEGNNYLLKEGAFPLTQVEDIFMQIPYLKKKGVDKKEEKILSDLEKDILNILNEPHHIDMLVEITGLNISELSIILFEMELKQLVKNDNGVYIKTV